ncbi:D-ribose ABC transporter substrate-binding protein [Petrocella atlantisensis]|uniref:D-ribose ABC transporter substrate-binding protein n=1 Tax=Petrocella atlantisensis TaxID=2173034 RepID=A0A3P7PQW4_9FIRM|nr:substrate-binding domain-containing protein [Petrocella atlantisensis]VDN46747.1 D-ribose ABC transporter substrate-binding protein [Petrocella atlantisensis]
MKMKLTATLLSMILIMTVFLVGCASSNEATELQAEAEDGYIIGLSMNTQTNPFFVDVKDGVQKAADEKGITLYITDAQDDPSIQMKDIENLITKKPNAIIIDPCDSDAIVAAVEACNEAGIAVFTMDRQSNGGEVIAHVGYDAIKSGKIAGQFLVDTLGGKGKIVEIQGIMGTNVAQNRSQGFNEIISENPNMEIVSTQVADFDRAKAMSVMENILQANKEIDGLYAANDEMLLGALEAIEAAGRSEEITMIGCDAIDDTLEVIKEERVEATIAEPPFFLGKAILNTAFDYLNGKEVEANVILDNSLVTIDNVETLVTKE